MTRASRCPGPRFAALAVLAAVLIGGPSAAGEIIAGVASVIDGDSLEIHGQQVRLHGIDAPEHDQPCERDGERYRCGQVAALALADKIGRRPVECEVRDTDRYGRAVAVCSLEGEDLGPGMVRRGLRSPSGAASRTSRGPDHRAGRIKAQGRRFVALARVR